jgi:hypothetical protein
MDPARKQREQFQSNSHGETVALISTSVPQSQWCVGFWVDTISPTATFVDARFQDLHNNSDRQEHDVARV